VSARYLTVTECAAMLGVEHKTVRRLIERGELPALRVGRLLRIDPAALESLRYRPTRSDPAAPTSRPRPRPARGEFARRARGLPAALVDKGER
jgi:excisionase family DNA binding protein